MSNFAVTITLQGSTREEIRSKLQLALGSVVARTAKIAKARVVLNYDEACRANEHFGCVHWTDEDVRSKAEELNLTLTEEMLDSVRSTYALRHIDDRMIEQGWEVITQAIFDAGIVESVT
jgi:hypothetical protein